MSCLHVVITKHYMFDSHSMVNLNVVEDRLNNKKESPCPAGFFYIFYKKYTSCCYKKLIKTSQPNSPFVCLIDI